MSAHTTGESGKTQTIAILGRMSEGLEGKKNPWGRGAEYEKEVRPEEVAKIRRMSAAETDAYTERQKRLESLPQAEREEFYEGLLQVGRVQESFEVHSSGRILIDPQQDDRVALWKCASLMEDISGKRLMLTCTPEDLMTAAHQIQRAHPEVQFEFNDERPKRFSYSAHIRETSE